MQPLPEEPLAPRAQAAVALLDAVPTTTRMLVLADADTDGVAAAALVARALHATGRRFTVRLSRRRDPAFFDALFAKPPAFLVTCDLGSAHIGRIESARIPTIVLDHHEPEKDGHGATLAHLNPHLVGEDGSKGASGAAVAWVFAKAVLERHGLATAALPAHALIGAEGDRHHGGGVERGLHMRLAQHAALEASITWQDGPALPDGPLETVLAGLVDPYIVRFQDDPTATAAALADIGIQEGAHAAALTHRERRSLGTLLTLELVAQGADPTYIPRLFAPVAHLSDGVPVPLLAAMVDAACRRDAATEALSALLGGSPERARIAPYLAAYEDAIRDGLASVRDLTALPSAGPALVAQVANGPFSGPVADRMKTWLATGSRPVAVYGAAGPRLKFSLRARETPHGPAWRLDVAADHAARAVGGIGGGHRLAAGASIPEAHRAGFLERLGRILEEQAGERLADVVAETAA